jgi:ADP-glucose pyrophosphorylase
LKNLRDGWQFSGLLRAGSIVSEDALPRGGMVRNPVLGLGVKMQSNGMAEDAIVLDNCPDDPGADFVEQSSGNGS